MVRAAMAERELEGLQADRPAEELVAEADADDRLLADNAPNRVDDVVQRRGVAGAVRQEHQVRLVREHCLSADGARQKSQPAIPLAELPNDGELDAGVDADDVRPVAVDLDRLCGSHGAGEVSARHRGLGGDSACGLGLGEGGGEEPAAHGAEVADVANQRPGVDAR